MFARLRHRCTRSLLDRTWVSSGLCRTHVMPSAFTQPARLIRRAMHLSRCRSFIFLVLGQVKSCVRMSPVPVVSQIPAVHMPVNAFPNAKDKFSLGRHKFQSFKFRFVVHFCCPHLQRWSGLGATRYRVCWLLDVRHHNPPKRTCENGANGITENNTSVEQIRRADFHLCSPCPFLPVYNTLATGPQRPV